MTALLMPENQLDVIWNSTITNVHTRALTALRLIKSYLEHLARLFGVHPNMQANASAPNGPTAPSTGPRAANLGVDAAHPLGSTCLEKDVARR